MSAGLWEEWGSRSGLAVSVGLKVRVRTAAHPEGKADGVIQRVVDSWVLVRIYPYGRVWVQRDDILVIWRADPSERDTPTRPSNPG